MRATREGKRFALATLLIAAAAFNTGNNLIYLILAMMLSLGLLAVVILKINLSGLSLAVSPLSPVYAGEEAAFSMTLRNAKRLVPSYSINLETEGAGSRPYYPAVDPVSEITRVVPIVFGRRGLYGYSDFVARSGFPFILCSAVSKLKVAGDVLVYPALVDVEEAVTDAAGLQEGDTARPAGTGEEIYSLRGFRSGDDLRQIHWKASAKASELMVKEYADYEYGKTTIILDNLRTAGVAGGNKDVFERAVSLAASFAKLFIEKGRLVRVISCGKVIPFGAGDEHLYKIFDILATVEEEDEWESPLPREGEGFVVIIQKTRRASRPAAASGDLVVYAETV